MSITRKNSMKMVSGFINNIGAGDSKFFDEEANPDKIKKLLDNASINKQSGINERLRALKWLLAQTTSGKDVSQFFPDVVKNVIVKDVEVKKFVYMYLSYYADQDDTTRELALLSINSFQRDMSSPNMLLRSLALRVMCSIRIRDIIQLQMLAVSTCARDSSPYVRKTAAYALPKLYRLDPEQKPQLVEILSKLIGDKSILVFGSALASFNEICPNQLGM
jgi:AP-3 complex subunit beta